MDLPVRAVSDRCTPRKPYCRAVYRENGSAGGRVVFVKIVAYDATMMQWDVKFFTVMDGGSVRLQ